MGVRLSDLPFTFITEDGEQRLTIPQYHTKDDLMKKIGLITAPTEGRRTLFVGTTIISLPYEILERDTKRRKLMDELEDMVRDNPLKYFVPQNETALMFLNDTEHNLKGFIAPNGAGKSCVGWIDVLLQICPCDPDWPIFKTHGVRHRRYRGPQPLGGVGVVSYEWNNHITTIWPQIVSRWTPKECLGEYAPGGGSVINWKNNPKVEIAGTPVWFFACSQAQTVFESSAMDIYWWDEQGEENKFNGANMRIRRRNGRHIFTLTPHRVEGRPDTGAGSWIHRMYSGEMKSGLNSKFYGPCSLEDIPDWVYSEDAKKQAYKEWIEEPTTNNDLKKLREGRSRYYGEFHESSGLVFDEFTPGIHVIEPFDIPEDWTKYRAIDHGRVEPTAALWAAVNPTGDIFLYREYYQKDKTVVENAREIIRASGNERVRREAFMTDRGAFCERYEEAIIKERYRRSVLDSRSMSKKTDNSEFTIGDLYKQEGLYVHPADGQPVTIQVPVAKELFRLDNDRPHYITGEKGAPSIYIFSNLKWFLWEINQYTNEMNIRMDRAGNKSVSEKPRAKNDHLMSCLLFLSMMRPVYISGYSVVSNVDNLLKRDSDVRLYDKYTGY